jgi:hypothetical protein
MTIDTRPLLGFVALLFVSCESTSYYLYYADEYEPDRDCVDTPTSIDVFTGTPPGTSCAVQCLAGPPPDGAVYATTMCGPPPTPGDISGSNPFCTNALAAFARGDFCLDGGGSTNPLDSSTPDALSLDGGADGADAASD